MPRLTLYLLVVTRSAEILMSSWSTAHLDGRHELLALLPARNEPTLPELVLLLWLLPPSVMDISLTLSELFLFPATVLPLYDLSSCTALTFLAGPDWELFSLSLLRLSLLRRIMASLWFCVRLAQSDFEYGRASTRLPSTVSNGTSPLFLLGFLVRLLLLGLPGLPTADTLLDLDPRRSVLLREIWSTSPLRKVTYI